MRFVVARRRGRKRLSSSAYIRTQPLPPPIPKPKKKMAEPIYHKMCIDCWMMEVGFVDDERYSIQYDDCICCFCGKEVDESMWLLDVIYPDAPCKDEPGHEHYTKSEVRTKKLSKRA